jgi:TorA maturation chaperone TorD
MAALSAKAREEEAAARDTDKALCRATLYDVLRTGFRPPTEETVERLILAPGASVVEEAARAVNPHLLGALPAAAAGVSVEELSASFQRVFGHAVQGGVCPYETEYGDGGIFQQPRELGDIAGFYRAFGVTVNPLEHERADHVSCECEFLLLLTLKEAFALEHGDEEMLRETRKGQRLFLRDHLGRFGLAFGKKLARQERGKFYGLLGELCARFLADECARVGVPAGPETLRLRPAAAAEEEVPMLCDKGAECPAAPGGPGPHGDISSR